MQYKISIKISTKLYYDLGISALRWHEIEASSSCNAAIFDHTEPDRFLFLLIQEVTPSPAPQETVQ
jgi:hypothetical protein